ncbi:MAG TPA: MmcQ/YjbR family DNA-binding protein [Phenylobacterium sp.]
MTKDEFHKAAMALPGATFDIKWGADHCYSVGGKMFAAVDEGFSQLGFKATEIAFEALIAAGRATPSRYLARAHWLNMRDLEALDAAEAADWLKTAHGLVAAKLTKKLRAEIGL